MLRYRKGANFERRCRRFLEEKGWFVIRSGGSKSPVDLVALRDGEIALIQCRVSGYLPQKEKEELLGIAKRNKCQAWVAFREGKKLCFKSLEHNFRIQVG